MSQPNPMMEVRSHRVERILSMLRTIFAEQMGIGAEELDDHKHFVEMGADSLSLLQVSQAIQNKLDVKIPFRVMLEEFSTLDSLAAHIDEQLPVDESPTTKTKIEAPAAQPTVPEELPQPLQLQPEPIAHVEEQTAIAGNSPLERVLTQQLQLMARQLELLHQKTNGSSQRTAVKTVETPKTVLPEPAPQKSVETGPRKIESPPFVPYRAIKKERSDGLTSQQREHIQKLSARLTAKTSQSKTLAAESRATLADNRATAGFRMLWKEMQYPLVADRASGSRLWDVDGNEYVDITMGFGALLFGHTPSFIVDAVQTQLERGLQLGTQSQFSGKAAALVCELTGVERATFCNSGTEAVMSALRLARTVTGRSRIALFEGCYHGTFDGVMVRAGGKDAQGRVTAIPLAPGVPEYMSDNVLLLKLNDPSSLDILRSQAHTLAAVLVEPMPSRFPDLRPEAFLRELRTITADAGAALIFDEVVTGFRFHRGGAQALFGIQADLVIYGKAAGAGIPIGILAGKRLYMDTIDGGTWNYGDDSYPRSETTFFAGTYFKNPMTMAGVCAALDHLKQSGTELQDDLNSRTLRLTEALNSYFDEVSLPAIVANFASIFRFNFSPELKYAELFYYHLLEKGVYVCETRNCFLSTAHTDRDLDFILQAVKETVAEMRAGGLFPSPDSSSSETRRIPLTEAQKELWVLTQLGEEASRAYNDSVVLKLGGRFDLEAMRNAIRNVVNRHEALRTTFSAEGDYQEIYPSISIDVPLTDVSQLQGKEREQRIREVFLSEANQVFDLVHGPVLRARIIKTDEDVHLVVLTAHHIVTDGVSNGILLQEIGSLYSDYSRGETGSLPEPMQYSEYAQALAGVQNSEQMAQAETYWLAQFSGHFPLLDMPTDRPRPSVQTYAGTRLQKNIDKAVLTKLKNFGAQQNCTLFMTLLAGYAALLHRLSDQQELVVGIPVAGQTMMGGKPLVGYCVNLVPLRSSIDEDIVFVDFLKSIKKTLLDAHHHYIYPFSRLAKQLDLPRDPSRAFPISAVFNLDRREKLNVIDFEAEVVDSPVSSTKFDLYLNITETDDELLFCLEYNADLFDAETVGRWLDHLTVLLQGAAVDPVCRVADLPLLSELEERRLLVKWNETTADYSKEISLHRLFERQVERSPEAVAVVFGNERLSYRELNERANQVARYLRTVGVKNEAIVGVSVERSPEMIVSLLGIVKAGAAYVPLDKEYPAERLAYMLRESGARVVVGKRVIEEKLKGRTEGVLLIDERDEEISRQSRENLEVEVRPESPAYVIFTSGSTGQSKGVVGLHSGAINRLEWMWRTYSYAAGEVCCQKTSLGFLDSLCEIFGPLSQGLPLVLIREQDVKDVGRLIEILGESEVSRLVVVPSLLRAMLDWDRELGKHLPKLKLWVTSGEALSTDLLARFKQQAPHAKLLNLYGMSEATADVTWADLSENVAEGKGVTIGRPISNTKIYVLNKNMEPAPIGVGGEVFVGGAGLARGYLNRPNLTAERFIPDRFSDEAGARLYRTGDLARWIGDGNIEYLGRVDAQVKIRGIRIEPGEIELALTDHDAVKQAVVVVRQGENGDQRLVAYVVARDGKQLRASEVKKHLRGTLPGYMVPSVVMVLDAMPLNESGKIDRNRLPEAKIRREDVEEEFVAPLSKVERQLAEIWEAVLPVEKVGAEDNFFDLGGDSILAIQIASRASQAGLHLTPKDIFERRTIAELAETIEAVSEAAVDQGPVAGAVPLTPIQHWFFEQELAQPHHYNQANLLRLEQPVAAAAVKRAVDQLIRHHDALRLRVVREEGQWRQYNAAPEESVPFAELDLSELSDSEVGAAITAECTRLQASLDLSDGPIIRVALITLGGERGARLLVVIHHLAVDIVSWGIILEDLSRACEQLSRGEGISLAAKTTSFKEWAERLAEYGRSAEVEREVGYWLSEQRRRVKRLPVDHEGENTEASAQTFTVEFGEEETRQLMQEVPRAYRTQLSEVLLAALAEAVSRWSGQSGVLVEVEGHGREESLVGGVDLTRTVGWFTSIYPVLLEVGGGPGQTLKRVKEQMRGAPGGGLSYGLLRYLGREEVVEKLRQHPRSEICFNFMSWFGGATDQFALTDDSHASLGPSRDPNGRRSYLLEVNGIAVGGRIQISWTYSENLHSRATIEALVDHFMSGLRSLIDHCVNKAAKSSVAKLNERNLDKALELAKF